MSCRDIVKAFQCSLINGIFCFFLGGIKVTLYLPMIFSSSMQESNLDAWFFLEKVLKVVHLNYAIKKQTLQMITNLESTWSAYFLFHSVGVNCHLIYFSLAFALC